jgi:cation diffusion facilitator CzcD-associated flavoprotein CzcO
LSTNKKVVTFNFNTQAKLWTTATNPITEKETSYTCQFILAAAVITTTPKATRLILKTSLFFKAHIHPQQWPKNLAIANKKVVVIGSGATAVTIVPELAVDAEHVTMLQRPQLILPPCQS